MPRVYGFRHIGPAVKVLLISPNIEFLPDPVFPIGIACLAGALKKNATSFRVLDLCFAQDYDTAIGRALEEYAPDIVCLSIRNIDNVSYPQYVTYMPFYRKVIESIRAKSAAGIAVGGSGFSLLPEACMRYLKADLGFAGEGERSLIDFINTCAAGGWVASGCQGKIIYPVPDRNDGLDDLPEPDRSGLDSAAYLQQGGMGNIQTKRGCPFQCIYCTYPIIEGCRIRMRSPEAVCDEIEHLLEAGMSTLFFVDNEFNYPPEHARAVCREIIARRLRVSWSCYAHPAFIAPDLVELMQAAGCTGIEFGSDAAEPGMLRNLGKNFTVDHLARASSACRSAGISFCHSLLLGGPGETMESVQQTCDTICAMDPTAVICMIAIRVFPRTKLACIAAEEKLIHPGTDFLEPVFYLSPALRDAVLPWAEQFSKSHPTWIFPGLNINMNMHLQAKLRRFGIKGPLWEYMQAGARRRRT